MTTHHLAPALTITILISAIPAAGQDVPPAIRLSASCAPVGTSAPPNAALVLALPSETKMLYTAGDRVAISAGTNHALRIGQRFFVRRPLSVSSERRGEHTVGWLHIVETRAASATAVVDFTCDAIAVGDHLVAFADPALPRDIHHSNATGTLDFSKSARVLWGKDGRQLTGDRDFVLVNAGKNDGVTPGARYAVYHGGRIDRDNDVPFSEAVVVSVFADKSLLRITDARDAVTSGDALVLRVGVAALATEGGPDAQRPTPDVTDGEGSAPAAAQLDDAATDLIHRVSFEDLAFDFDRFTLKPDALALLDQAVQVLEKNPTLRINVEGYSCNIGSVKYNLALGKRRANAVRDYLLHHGVASNRLTTTSYGEAAPKYDNSHEDTRRLNRRAALVINIER